MRAGCSISDSTAPNDSASVKISVDSATRSAASSPSRNVNETMPPKPRIWLRAISCWGCDGRPGQCTSATAGWATNAFATAAAFDPCRSIRTGSVFTPRSTRKQSNGDGTAPTGTATLLYIEDNAPNVHVVEHVLALRPGWTMIHAPLGGLGVELARAHHPDLVLLDLHLPDQPGADVLLALKRRDDTKDIPVVVLTADASPGLASRLVRAGAERFITKPLNVDGVLELLDQVSLGRLGNTTEPAEEASDE